MALPLFRNSCLESRLPPPPHPLDNSTNALTRTVTVRSMAIALSSVGSDVVVQVELPGVGAEADLVDLPLALVGEPGLDEVGCEDAARQQVLVVGLEGAE